MIGRTKLIYFVSLLYINADLIRRIYFDLLEPKDNFFVYYIFLLNISLTIAYILNVANKVTKKSNLPPNIYVTFFCVAAIYFILLQSSGISFDPLFDRSERANTFFTSQTWVILYNILMSIAFLCTYQFFITSRRSIKILLFSIVFSIVCIDVLGLGARRVSAIIALTILGHPLNTDFFFKRITGIFLVIVALFLGLFIGAYREIVLLRILGNPTELHVLEIMLRNNEFTEIGNGLHKGLTLMIENGGYLWGYSYILFPIFFIPRSLFSEKPLSLTNEYQAATSPFIEGFYNFGFVGVFPVTFLFICIFSVVRKNLFWGTFVFAYSMEILRSDFSVLAYNMIITFITIKILTCRFSQS